MLAAESELLDALNRLGTADSDVEWQQAVSARDHALRRLLIAVSDLPVETRELVVARATRALASDRRTPPKGRSATDSNGD